MIWESCSAVSVYSEGNNKSEPFANWYKSGLALFGTALSRPSAAKYAYAATGWYKTPHHGNAKTKTLTPHNVVPKLFTVSGKYAMGSVCAFIKEPKLNYGSNLRKDCGILQLVILAEEDDLGNDFRSLRIFVNKR